MSEHKKTVLIVEDDKNIQKLLADLLESEGFAVLTDGDGKWALQTATNREVDLMICDVLIPGLNGFQLVEKLRGQEKTRDLPVIMVTGVYRGVAHRREAIEKYGVVEYLEKPLKFEELVSILRAQLGSDYPGQKPAEGHKGKATTAEDTLADSLSVSEKQEVESAVARNAERVAALRGSLKKMPFAELLAQLYRMRASGALLMRTDKVKKIVYLREGRPVFVKSNLLNECLGRVLVTEGMISEAECEESIQLMKSTGRQQGTVLIEMGCISPHNLVFGLEKQLQVKLFDIFGWPDAEYQFNPNAETPKAITTLEMTTANIIWEGIKRTHDEDRLAKLLRNDLERYVAPSADPLYRYQELNLFDDEVILLELVDGSRTAEDVIAQSKLDRPHALKLLYACNAADMIQFFDEPATQYGVLKKASRLHPPPLRRPPPLTKSSKASPPSLADRKLRSELSELAHQMKRQNYFEILGVTRRALRDDIKRAFNAKAQELHPDRSAPNASPETRELAREIYHLVEQAYETLIDDNEREAYSLELATGVKRDVSGDVSRVLAAEGQFQKGEMFLRRKQFDKASQCFQEAIKLYEGEGEFHVFLGWSMFLGNPNDDAAAQAAMTHISDAIGLNPKLDKAYLYMGYILKHRGEQDRAEQQFEKAIQCNPDCTEALRELKLLSLRREKAPGSAKRA